MTATVNCTFDKDVSGLQFIVRRKRNEKAGKRYCDVLEGFAYTWNPGNKQTVFIANVSKDYEGEYVCQLEACSEKYCNPCRLEVRESRRLDNSMKVDTGETDKPEQESSPRRKKTFPAGWIGSIVAGIVVVVVIIGVAVIFIRRKRRNSGAREENMEDGEREPGEQSDHGENETQPMEPALSSSSSATSTSPDVSEKNLWWRMCQHAPFL
ncbi:hypothetical protein BaRGS_00024575 [Batillaria attramentaria]|uniref:Ig-like domain-containing protein n=1 Tax=Batillaria attramentaria TaxID=370345 RepID=A0ABD0KB21_9CAEN